MRRVFSTPNLEIISYGNYQVIYPLTRGIFSIPPQDKEYASILYLDYRLPDE